VTLFLQLLLNGVVVGSFYAILGLSFALIYWTTRIFHFAHGIVYTVAGYAIYTAVVPLGLPVPVGIPLGALAAMTVGVGCELLMYRPLRRRRASAMTPMIASLGLFIILQNLFVVFYTADARPLTRHYFRPIDLGPLTTTWLKISTVLVAAAVFAVVLGFLHRTGVGRAIRAIVDNPRMARVVGIDLDRTYLLVYALGSVLVVPAAFIATLDRGASPDMGLPAVLTAAVAVFVGGVGAIPAAALAGLLVGVAENVSVLYIGTEWQLTLSFLILIVFLLFRPRGILGRRERAIEV
jgi:branched-chain amino acid transport system permease protein